MDVSGQLHVSARKFSGIYRLGGWMDLETGLKAVENRKVYDPARD
jgi:hypothetical protein